MNNINFFGKNIDSMRGRFDDIVAYLLDSHDIIDDEVDFENRVKPQVMYFDDVPRLVVEQNGNYIQLDSFYDSATMFKSWRKCFDIEDEIESKILMYGFGCGVFARGILKTVPNDCTLIVYEPSEEIFREVLNHYDLSDLFMDKRLIFFLEKVTEKVGITHAYAKVINYIDYYNAKQVYYPNYEMLFPNGIQNYLKGVQNATLSVQANQTLFANCGIECNENTFFNAKYFLKSCSLEKIKNNMPEDFPVIVVAGGPSLDKNIHELKAAKGKALIIATDTSLNALYKAEIVPDIAISTDALKGEKYFASDVSKNVPLVCGFHVGYKGMASHTGIKMFKNEFKPFIQGYLSKIGKNLPMILSGGSVANDALYLGYYFGSKRIILIGQDLAYTDDKTHSSATVEGEIQTDNPKFRYEKWEESIYGTPIRSSYQFVLYRDWIEGMIISHEDLHIIDATEGGIKIHGSEIMTLRDAIERECKKEYDFENIIATTEQFLSDEEGKMFVEHMCSLQDEIVLIKNLSEEGLNIYKKLRNMVNNNSVTHEKVSKCLQEIAIITERIESINGLEFVRNRIQDRINESLKTINKTKKDENEELLEICKVGMASFKDLIEAIDDIMPQLLKMEEEIRL